MSSWKVFAHTAWKAQPIELLVWVILQASKVAQISGVHGFFDLLRDKAVIPASLSCSHLQSFML